MNRVLVVLSVLIVSATAAYIALLMPKPNSTETQVTETAALTPQTPASPSVPEPDDNQPVATPHQSTAKPEEDDHEDDHSHGADDVNFESLSLEIQDEILRLSNRPDQPGVPIEVSPGLFKLPSTHVPKIVPVAVINEDGSISITEF